MKAKMVAPPPAESTVVLEMTETEAGREVVFKAEVGSQSPAVGQIQGVWVHPDWRGHGLGTAGTAALAAAVVGGGRMASLYVNDYNTVARATYDRIGFEQIGTFATILLD